MAEPSDGPWLFLRKFLRHGTRVASVMPSSRYLASAMCKLVRADQPQVILELGAGTGAVTKVALQRKHPDSQLLAVELDPDFSAVLAKDCPGAVALCCDVAELRDRLPAMGIHKVDLVLSGLPTPSLPKFVNEAVMSCFEQFAADAAFSQLTVMPLVYKPLYQRLFEQVDFQFVPLNFPSGGVYHCRRLRSDWREHLPGK